MGLDITVTTQKMPHTSEFFAIVKAVEHFYYALLFSTDATYQTVESRWETWLSMGFSNAIRDAPPMTEDADRLARRVRSDGKRIEIRVAARKHEVLDALAHVLGTVRSGAATEARDSFVEPVLASLRNCGVTNDGIVSFATMLQRGIDALTHRDIISFEVSADDNPELAPLATTASPG